MYIEIYKEEVDKKWEKVNVILLRSLSIERETI